MPRLWRPLALHAAHDADEHAAHGRRARRLRAALQGTLLAAGHSAGESLMGHYRGLAGIAAMIFFSWLLSMNRRRFPLKTVIGGLLLQWVLALIVLRTYYGRAFFEWIGSLVTVLLRGADEGAKFVFGPLAGSDLHVTWSAVAGIKIMTTIIAVATLTALAYHYGIMQVIVRAMSWVMTRTLGVTGAESLSGAANVFLGQTEAPLFVKPLLPNVTQSELMAIMAGGFANISAGVMAFYV